MLWKIKCLIKIMTLFGKKSGNARFTFAFIYNGETYGIWNDYKQGRVFISYDYLKETPYLFSMSLSDSKPNIMMIKSLKKYKFWKNFIENFSLRYRLF